MSDEIYLFMVMGAFVFLMLTPLWISIFLKVKKLIEVWNLRHARVFKKARKALLKVLPESERSTTIAALDECESYYAHLEACESNLNLFTEFIKMESGGYLPQKLSAEIGELKTRLMQSKRWMYHQYLSLIAVPSRPGVVQHLLEQIRERRKVEEEIFLDLDKDTLSEEIEEASKTVTETK